MSGTGTVGTFRGVEVSNSTLSLVRGMNKVDPAKAVAIAKDIAAHPNFPDF